MSKFKYIILPFFFSILLYLNDNIFYYSINSYDGLSILFCLFIFLFIILSVEKQHTFKALIFIVFTGSSMIILSENLLIIFLGVELQTFSILILLGKSKIWLKSSEASLKYFILSSVSTGLFILGLVLYYVNQYHLTEFQPHHKMAIVMFLALFFKLGSFPAHWIIGDVNEGATYPVISVLGSMPKIAVLTLLMKWGFIAGTIDPYIFCGVINIFLGTFLAFNQTKIKRLLAYSSLNNMGYLLLCIGLGQQSILQFFLFNYIISFISILFVLNIFNLTEEGYLVELKGTSSPWNFIFLVLTFSLSGIPPFSGFVAKLLIMYFLYESGNIVVLFFIIICSILSTAFYLRLIKIAFFQDSSFYSWRVTKEYSVFGGVYFLGFMVYIVLTTIFFPNFFLYYIWEVGKTWNIPFINL